MHIYIYIYIYIYICSQCNYTTNTVLTTQRCILMDYFNCNFSEHKLMRSLMMV